MVKKSFINDFFLIGVILALTYLIFTFIGLSPHTFFILGGLAIFFIAFFRTDFALVVLIFSMLLSPEFGVGHAGGREVMVRLDDIFLFIVFLGWMAKMAVSKELGLLRISSLNLPILAYIAVCIISSILGILRGEVTFKGSIFYILKYVEYFLVFFMVTNNIRDMEQIKKFIFYMIFVCFLISLYAWFSHSSGAERVSAPFEGKSGEPNTLGGYLLLLIMVCIGLLLNLEQRNYKIFLFLVIFFAFPAFLFTLSRGSWLGFILGYPVLIFLTKKGKTVLLGIFIILLFLSSVVFPKYVYKRVQETFSKRTERTILGRRFNIDPSAAARIDTWREGIKLWSKSPFWGHGVGIAGSVVDNEYTRILIEVGLIGFAAFFWIILTLFKHSFINLRLLEYDNFSNGIIAGFSAGLVGLLGHCLSAGTFIIIRIMEPFWFFAAIVMLLPELINETSPSASPEGAAGGGSET
jgi:O-antigen ligase